MFYDHFLLMTCVGAKSCWGNEGRCFLWGMLCEIFCLAYGYYTNGVKGICVFLCRLLCLGYCSNIETTQKALKKILVFLVTR